MLSVARQLVVGPGELYGPFGGRNPLVLIHAPLYYRVAALAAWPMARGRAAPGHGGAGGGPVAVGPGFAGDAGGGLPPGSAGWRFAACGVVGGAADRRRRRCSAGQPFAVRPDMAGVALQTAGVLLVLSALEGGSGASRRVIWGYAAFGLSACVKQHLVAGAAVSTILLLLGGRGSQVRVGAIVTGPGGGRGDRGVRLRCRVGA